MVNMYTAYYSGNDLLLLLSLVLHVQAGGQLQHAYSLLKIFLSAVRQVCHLLVGVVIISCDASSALR